jgi:hypothetical protein
VAETVVNYVVESRKGDRPWQTMWNTAGDEEAGRAAYNSFLASKRVKGFALDYRLVRRTAVITDEVLETSEPEIHAHTVDGPADCTRCQFLRENAYWMALPEKGVTDG